MKPDLKIILKKLDYYFIFLPNNNAKEKVSFFNALNTGKIYNPQFKYAPVKISEIKSIIRNLAEFSTVDKVEQTFINLYKEIAELILAWIKNDYQSITDISGNLFGSYKDIKPNEMIVMYQKLKAKSKVSKKTYLAKELGEDILNEFKNLKMKGWKIVYDDNNPSEASIYEDKKEVILKASQIYSYESHQRIICHEIYGHAFQAFNARLNKDYQDYLLSYLGTEKQYEGIAIFVEINKLPQSFMNTIFSRYLILMLANYYAAHNSFYDTYSKIFELTNDQEFSYMSTLRAKRGFKNTAEKGSFQKENSYLFGVYETINLVISDKKNFLKLFQGNFPFSLLPQLNEKNTKWNPLKNIQTKKIKIFNDELKNIYK